MWHGVQTLVFLCQIEYGGNFKHTISAKDFSAKNYGQLFPNFVRNYCSTTHT